MDFVGTTGVSAVTLENVIHLAHSIPRPVTIPHPVMTTILVTLLLAISPRARETTRPAGISGDVTAWYRKSKSSFLCT